MPLTSSQISTLATEIASDPAGILTGLTVDQDIADALNLPRAAGAFQQNKSLVTKAQLFSCIDPTEFDALTDKKLQQIQCISDPLDVSDTSTRGILQKIFAGASTTIAAFQAFLKRSGSRAEVLFGAGSVVTAQDVAKARGRAT